MLHCSSQKIERSQDGVQAEMIPNFLTIRGRGCLGQIIQEKITLSCFSRSQFLFQAKFPDGVVLFKCGQRFNNLLPLFSWCVVVFCPAQESVSRVSDVIVGDVVCDVMTFYAQMYPKCRYFMWWRHYPGYLQIQFLNFGFLKISPNVWSIYKIHSPKCVHISLH